MSGIFHLYEKGNPKGLPFKVCEITDYLPICLYDGVNAAQSVSVGRTGVKVASPAFVVEAATEILQTLCASQSFNFTRLFACQALVAAVVDNVAVFSCHVLVASVKSKFVVLLFWPGVE